MEIYTFGAMDGNCFNAFEEQVFLNIWRDGVSDHYF
jgi:hypothetical protein